MQDKNKTQLYIQLSRHNEVQEGPVRLTDVAKVYGLGTEEKKKLEYMLVKISYWKILETPIFLKT